MTFDDLTDEQKARVKACKTADELIALAKEEGVELSEEQLNSISGGDSWWCPTATSCPNYEVMRYAAALSAHGRMCSRPFFGVNVRRARSTGLGFRNRWGRIQTTPSPLYDPNTVMSCLDGNGADHVLGRGHVRHPSSER